MKLSVKKLSLVLALLLTVAIAPAAWSATLGASYEVTGIVYQCEPGSGITIDTNGEIITVYGMGPVSYWGELAFPEVGEPITLLVSEITYSDSTSKLVAIAIDLDGEPGYEIYLRDEDTGVPLWRKGEPALTQTQTRGNR